MASSRHKVNRDFGAEDETKDVFFHLEMLPDNSRFAYEVLCLKSRVGSAINTSVPSKESFASASVTVASKNP